MHNVRPCSHASRCSAQLTGISRTSAAAGRRRACGGMQAHAVTYSHLCSPAGLACAACLRQRLPCCPGMPGPTHLCHRHPECLPWLPEQPSRERCWLRCRPHCVWQTIGHTRGAGGMGGRASPPARVVSPGNPSAAACNDGGHCSCSLAPCTLPAFWSHPPGRMRGAQAVRRCQKRLHMLHAAALASAPVPTNHTSRYVTVSIM